jgi:hypothetical protein
MKNGKPRLAVFVFILSILRYIVHQGDLSVMGSFPWFSAESQSTRAQYMRLSPGFGGPFCAKFRFCATLRKTLQPTENRKDKGPAMLSL